MRRTDVLQGIRLMKFEEIFERTRSRELRQEAAGLVLGVSSGGFGAGGRVSRRQARRVFTTAAWAGCRRIGCRWTR